MRVYVPLTWSGLASVRVRGLPAGTTGYAVTTTLARELQVLGGADGVTGEELDDLADVAVDTAAEASLLLLVAQAAQLPGAQPQGQASGQEQGAGQGVAAPPRRVVLVVTADVSSDPDDDHPAAVVLDAPLVWSQVDSVVADDLGDAPAVAAAVALAATDHEAAVAALEAHALGWFDPSETG